MGVRDQQGLWWCNSTPWWTGLVLQEERHIPVWPRTARPLVVVLKWVEVDSSSLSINLVMTWKSHPLSLFFSPSLSDEQGSVRHQVLQMDPEERRLHLDPVQRHHRHKCQECQREEHRLGQLCPQVRHQLSRYHDDERSKSRLRGRSRV